MTDCEKFESLIVRAVDEMLDEPSRARLDQHLATCASCRAKLAVQQEMRDLLRARPVVYASADFAARVRSAIGAGVPWLAGWDFRRWTWRLVPVAAALAIAVVAVVSRTAATSNATQNDTTIPTDMPVASALWSSTISDTSMLSLMLSAHADDALSKHVSDKQQ